jgi:hypothetical protein
MQNNKMPKVVNLLIFCAIAMAAFGGRRILHMGDAMEALDRCARHLECSLSFVIRRLPDNPEMRL